MKFPTFKRIYKTDFPTQEQSLVEKLSLTINNGFEVIYNAMARNVSLSDNVACTVKTISVKVDSSGTPTSSLSFKLDVVGQIKGISVVKAENLTNSNVYVTSHPFLTYTQNDMTITVNNVSGLPANNTFNITLIAWA
jgi:hypothetical protein